MTKTYDLTTGSLAKHFMRLAVPAAIGMVFSTLYNVVDVFFAGMIGTDAQAGLAISFQAFFIFVTIGFGLSAAMTALVGNAIGAKKTTDASIIAAQGIGFSIVTSVLLIVAARFIGPHLLAIISTEGAYRTAGEAYFMILILSLPGFIMGYGLNGILQAQGDTVSMQYALIGAFFANIGLNPLMMFGIPGIWGGLGFDGIAAATVISQTGVMVYIGFRLMRSGLLDAKTRQQYFTKSGFISSNSSAAIANNIHHACYVYRRLHCPILSQNIRHSSRSRLWSCFAGRAVILIASFGLTGALLPIAAQNFGANQSERVRMALLTCWKFGWVFMFVACPLLYFSAPLLMRSFTSDRAVIDIGVSYLRIDVFVLPIYMMLFAINSFLQALKRPIWTLLIGIYRQAFGVAFFSFVFVYVWGFGVVGVWYGIATSVLTGMILSLFIANQVALPLVGGIFSGQETRKANISNNHPI